TFFCITGSKSKTLIASLGVEINLSRLRGAHTIGSGRSPGRSFAKAARSEAANSGLAARNCRNLRRLASFMASDDMRRILPDSEMGGPHAVALAPILAGSEREIHRQSDAVGGSSTMT